MKKLLMTVLIACLMISTGCKKMSNKAVITVDNQSITKQEIDNIVDKQINSPFFASSDSLSI